MICEKECLIEGGTPLYNWNECRQFLEIVERKVNNDKTEPIIINKYKQSYQEYVNTLYIIEQLKIIEVKNEDKRKINNYERISNRNINLIKQYVNKNNEKVLDIDLDPSINNVSSTYDIVLRDIEKTF